VEFRRPLRPVDTVRRRTGCDVDWLHDGIRRLFARYLDENGTPASRRRRGDRVLRTPFRRHCVGHRDCTCGCAVVELPRRSPTRQNMVVGDGGFSACERRRGPLWKSLSSPTVDCGLPKRPGRGWVPATRIRSSCPRTSEGLYMLQRVRDRAHRFAILTTTHTARCVSSRWSRGALCRVPCLATSARPCLQVRVASKTTSAATA